MAKDNSKIVIKKVFVREALWSAPWDASDMSSRIVVGETKNLRGITLDPTSGILEFDTTAGFLYLHISCVRMASA